MMKNIPLPPEILERRRAQLRVARRVLDRSVSEPILDASRVVAGIGESVAAGVAQHVGVNRKSESGALADALDQLVDRIRREWAAALGGEHER